MTEAGVDITHDAEVPVAHLSGEIDLSNVAAVERELQRAVAREAPGLVVDLSAVVYLDSQTINLLMRLARKLHAGRRRLVLAAPAWCFAHHVLKVTHVDDDIPMLESTEEAVAQLR